MISQGVLCTIKQMIATGVSGMLSLCAGIAFGFSAVLLPQLKTDENFPYDERYLSWIAAMAPLSMVFGSFFAGSIIDALGRKTGHAILGVSFVVSWLAQAFAYNNPLMLLGRFLTGLCSGAIRPISLVYLGEIANPKYRGLMLFTPSLTLTSGLVLNHALGNYVHWKTNSLICCAPSVIALMLTFILKESPLWLISKGKLEEGVEHFKWFRGESEAAVKELNSILEGHKQKSTVLTFKDYLNSDFLKPLGVTMLLSVGTHFNGANILTFYAQDILGLLIPNDYTPYTLMITADCVRLVASTVVFFLVNFVPRKISLLFSSFSASIILYCLMGFLYLDLSTMRWFSIVLLVAYVSMGSAVVTFTWSFVAELYPSQFRGVGSGASSAASYFALFVVVKITPGIVDAFGVKALFLGFATITVANAVLLLYLLPETSGRSLQDIENNMKKNVKTNRKVSQNVEETNKSDNVIVSKL